MPQKELYLAGNKEPGAWLRLEYLLAVLLFTGAAVIFSLGVDDILRFGLSDNNHYVFLGESLAKGNGYRDMFLVSNRPETRIPPGGPLIFAALIRARGLDIPAMKVIQLCFHFTTGLFFLLIFLRASSRFEAILGFALGLICPLSMMQSKDVGAEAPYTFCVALCLWIFIRSAPGIPSPRRLLLAGTVIAASVMFRMQGISLWLTALVAVAFAPRERTRIGASFKRIVLLSLVPSAVLLAWLFRNYMVSGLPGTDYVYWFMHMHPEDETVHPVNYLQFALMVKDNIIYYLDFVFRLAFPIEQLLSHVPAKPLWECILLVGLLWGLVKNLRSSQRIPGIYYVIFAMMILLWVFQVDSYSTSTYYIIPWLMVTGFNDLVFKRIRKISFLPGRLMSVIPVVLAFAWLAELIYVDLKIIDNTIPNTLYPPMRVAPHYRVAAPAKGLEQMRYLLVQLNMIDRKGLLMCHSPQHMARVLGRPCINMPILEPEDMLRYIESNNVDYVMVDQMFPLTRDCLLPVVLRNKDRFKMVAQVPDDFASVWKVMPSEDEKGSRPDHER